MLAMIGTDPQTGTQRWAFGSLYLWEGLHLIPIVLGLFALPELCDLAIARSSITGGRIDVKRGQSVRIGDVIGRAGATGQVQTSQLHFQLRKNRIPVDPMKQLPPR